MALFFSKKKPDAPVQGVVQELPLKAIVPNRFQPRKVFPEAAIAELASTIQTHGLLQPIVVREYEPQQYEIIAGERRFRAMQSLHMATTPALVQEMTDTESASMALIENLQRENLSPIEEARAYTDLMTLNGLTQQALAQQMAKSQSFIANKLRLLKLSEPVQTALLNGEITERHGRELLRLDDYQQQLVLHTVLKENLTVKETAAAVAAVLTPEATETPATADADPEQASSAGQKAKPKKKPAKPHVRFAASKDTRMAINTLNQSVALIRQTGLDVTVEQTETEDSVQVTVAIQKPTPGPPASHPTQHP